jgi:hypothetical protein
MQIRYVTDGDGEGWLLVVPDGERPETVAANRSRGWSLPMSLKVDLLDIAGGRERFRILEGRYSGRIASVRVRGPGQSYLTAIGSHQSSATVNLNRRTQQLRFDGRGPFSAFTQGSNPVPMGTHDLEIPDAPHVSPVVYRGASPYFRTWFLIGHDLRQGRYLHLGFISHGCATVRPEITRRNDPRFAVRSDDELGLPIPAPAAQLADWTDIYTYLIGSRKGDGKSVGLLVVAD